MSFDTGTCRVANIDTCTIDYTYASAVTAWTPVYVTGQGVLIPKASSDASTKAAYYKRGIFNFIVANGVTVTAGNRVYYDVTNGVITTTAPTIGFILGTALETGTGNSAGSVVVNVEINTFPEEGNINVYASTGLFRASYASIDLAIAALVANDILVIRSGSYTLAGACDIEVPGVKIVGDGVVEIVGAAGADYCFKTVLGALTATAELTFKNITIDHGDDATQVGIQIDNTSATKKVNVYLNDCGFESDGGNSIDIDHGDTSNAIRMYCDACTFEGPVNAVVADNGDRFRFHGCTLRGGLVTSAGDFDAEILLCDCIVLHEGITGGHANQRLTTVGCVSETDADPNVYAILDTADAAGSHTEQLLSLA
jgi:predicted RecA/RadA family phage recombinase